MIVRSCRRLCDHRSIQQTLVNRARVQNFWSQSAAPAVSSTPEIYDVVCVGGGPAGLALVTALSVYICCSRRKLFTNRILIGANEKTSKLKIALIDGQDLDASKQQFKNTQVYSNRCSSLTPGSTAFLRSEQHFFLSTGHY